MLQRRELSWSRCLELLGSRGVGRVAVSSPDGPLIYPVNHTLLDDVVWFRVPAHHGIAVQLGGRAAVALEVDQLDEADVSGWAVVVRGEAIAVDDPELLDRVLEAWHPRPWAVPGRFVYLRMRLEDVNGREVGPAPA